MGSRVKILPDYSDGNPRQGRMHAQSLFVNSERVRDRAMRTGDDAQPPPPGTNACSVPAAADSAISWMRRCDLAARADQQHAWVMAGDERGVYGPAAAQLMRQVLRGR